jgi:uncharacterized protein (DUF2336 family)
MSRWNTALPCASFTSALIPRCQRPPARHGNAGLQRRPCRSPRPLADALISRQSSPPPPKSVPASVWQHAAEEEAHDLIYGYAALPTSRSHRLMMMIDLGLPHSPSPSYYSSNNCTAVLRCAASVHARQHNAGNTKRTKLRWNHAGRPAV